MTVNERIKMCLAYFAGTAKQVAEMVDAPAASVRRSLAQLEASGEVVSEPAPGGKVYRANQITRTVTSHYDEEGNRTGFSVKYSGAAVTEAKPAKVPEPCPVASLDPALGPSETIGVAYEGGKVVKAVVVPPAALESFGAWNDFLSKAAETFEAENEDDDQGGEAVEVSRCSWTTKATRPAPESDEDREKRQERNRRRRRRQKAKGKPQPAPQPPAKEPEATRPRALLEGEKRNALDKKIGVRALRLGAKRYYFRNQKTGERRMLVFWTDEEAQAFLDSLNK